MIPNRPNIMIIVNLELILLMISSYKNNFITSICVHPQPVTSRSHKSYLSGLLQRCNNITILGREKRREEMYEINVKICTIPTINLGKKWLNVRETTIYPT